MNALAILDRFPCIGTLTSRYGDLDADNLLSDMALARYVEQARSHLLTELLRECDIDLRSPDCPIAMLIAHSKMEVLRHAAPAPEIQLASGVSRIGGSSVQLQVGVFSDGRCLAVADNVLVFVARTTGRPTAVPSILRDKLTALLCRQA
jgi:acyl-CoA thioesterase FadM